MLDQSAAATESFAKPLERLRGQLDLSFVADDSGRTRLQRFYQDGSARARLPRGPGALEAVLINTGGGLTGGDRLAARIAAGPGAQAVVTAQAAEKIYRSAAGEAQVSTQLTVSAGARLDWLPQETILFEGGRLARRLDADVEADGTLLLVESTVFGRTASGETVRNGLFRDDWRIRRAGRLAYADSVRLDGDIEAQLHRRAVTDGARAIGAMVYLAPDAEGRVDEVRSLIDGTAFTQAGASSWPGILVSRFLAMDGKSLKQGLTRLLNGFRGVPLPRVWSC